MRRPTWILVPSVCIDGSSTSTRSSRHIWLKKMAPFRFGNTGEVSRRGRQLHVSCFGRLDATCGASNRCERDGSKRPASALTKLCERSAKQSAWHAGTLLNANLSQTNVQPVAHVFQMPLPVRKVYAWHHRCAPRRAPSGQNHRLTSIGGMWRLSSV